MATASLERIESDIGRLSVSEQLWLMERLAHRLRRSVLRPLVVRDADLAAMAEDLAVQQELQAISAEFADTEMDGLGPES
jgi:hypothetical protein